MEDFKRLTNSLLKTEKSEQNDSAGKNLMPRTVIKVVFFFGRYEKCDRFIVMDDMLGLTER